MNKFKQKQQEFLDTHEQIGDMEYVRLMFRPSFGHFIGALMLIPICIALIFAVEFFASLFGN